MPALADLTLLAAKCESTAGTDAVPTAADNAIKVYGLEFSPLGKSSSLERSSRLAAHWSGQGSVSGVRAGTVRCSFYLHGSGSAGAAPSWAPLLLACGFQQDITAATSALFKPVSTIATGAWSATSDKSGWCPVSVYVWSGSTSGGSTCKLYKFTGCAGTASFSGEYGKPVKATVDLQGVYSTPTITTLPSGTIADEPTPVSLTNQTFTVSTDGVTFHEPVLTKFEVSMGSRVSLKERVGTTTGFTYADHYGRNPTLRLTVEEPETFTPAGGFDWWSAWENGTSLTTDTYAVFLSGGSGNNVQLRFPAFTVNAVSRSGGDGISTYNLTATLDADTASTGDDEFTILIY